MPIERLIQGSIPRGIESEAMGYQVYTQTPGCPQMETFLNNFRSFYDPPKIYDYSDWYDNEKNNTQAFSDKEINLLANKASLIAGELQPACFTFSSVNLKDNKYYYFYYGKDMGFDWSAARPFAEYYSVVLCEENDISTYPITYCASPVVCCDIKREAFFPNDGSTIPAPSPLKYLKSLNDKNDLMISHSAGFNQISIEEVFQFIQSENRIDILKNMLSALIQLKSGNKNCNIIIADKKENILKWIYAITYVFPFESALDISFSTYRYKFENSFDISGAYIPELNGRNVPSQDMDNIPITEYNCKNLQNTYAVYDFKDLEFGSHIEIYNNIFTSLIENAFSINKQILDSYKKYISTSTTYRKVDASYMDGTILYMFLEKNKRLTPEQMKLALIFAEKYANINEKKRIYDRIMMAYKDYISDAEMLEIIIDFIRYCVEHRITEQSTVENIFMTDVKTAFLDYANHSFDAFLTQGTIAEKFCGYKSGQLEVKLTSVVDLSKLCEIIDEFKKNKETQRINYVHTMICHFVKTRNGSFKPGTYEEKIAEKIINIYVVGDSSDNENRLNSLIDKTNQIVDDYISQFYYSDIAYRTVSSNGYVEISKNIVERIARAYINLNSEQKKHYIDTVSLAKESDMYLKLILAAINLEYEPLKRLSVLSEAVTNNRNAFTHSVTLIKRIAMNTENSKVNSLFYYKVFKLFKTMESTYGVYIENNEITSLLSKYIDRLILEHRDFILDEETSRCLRELNNEYIEHQPDETTFTEVNAFMMISEMGSSVSSRMQNFFYGNSKIKPLYLNDLKKNQLSSIIESMGKLTAKYWLSNEKTPVIDNWFDFESETQKQRIYRSLMGEILDNVLNGKSRNRYDVATQVIELAIFHHMDEFLNDLPDMLLNTVRQSDILKPLEKDIDSKARLKVKSGILAQIEVEEIREVVDNIRDAYEERNHNSTMGKVKRVINNIFDNFKKEE